MLDRKIFYPMPELSLTDKKRIVYQRAKGCCEYCRTCEVNIGQKMHVDHIIPDGNNDIENLCLSCWNCNTSKSSKTHDIDPETGEITPLFNPREQDWADHFEWIDFNLRIQGITPVGRSTVKCLRMNRPMIIIARKRWIEGGYHPPK